MDDGSMVNKFNAELISRPCFIAVTSTRCITERYLNCFVKRRLSPFQLSLTCTAEKKSAFRASVLHLQAIARKDKVDGADHSRAVTHESVLHRSRLSVDPVLLTVSDETTPSGSGTPS